MSERIGAGEIRTSTVTEERIDTDALPNSNEPDRSRKKGVRQRNELASPPPSLANLPYRPAHPSNRLVAQLNETWRVIDDPLQWILQRKKGNPRKKNSGWRDRSFCRTRDALLRCVREYCGEVDPSALATLKALSDWHPDWDRRRQRANLGVPGNAAPNFVEMPQ
jgi:hypothetical protein